jgi:hypothetical protein
LLLRNQHQLPLRVKLQKLNILHGWAQGHVKDRSDIHRVRYYFNSAKRKKSSVVQAKETTQPNALLSYRLLKATLQNPEQIYRLLLFKQTVASQEWGLQ